MRSNKAPLRSPTSQHRPRIWNRKSLVRISFITRLRGWYGNIYVVVVYLVGYQFVNGEFFARLKPLEWYKWTHCSHFIKLWVDIGLVSSTWVNNIDSMNRYLATLHTENTIGLKIRKFYKIPFGHVDSYLSSENIKYQPNIIYLKLNEYFLYLGKILNDDCMEMWQHCIERITYISILQFSELDILEHVNECQWCVNLRIGLYFSILYMYIPTYCREMKIWQHCILKPYFFKDFLKIEFVNFWKILTMCKYSYKSKQNMTPGQQLRT